VFICDETKLDDRGCCGAPDLVIEILSPGNSRKEVRLKYDIYEEAGVLEYWLVNPVEQNLVAYSLDNSGKFSGGKMYASGDLIYTTSIEGLTIPISELFENT
jgi:Uma2 family endonuclease